MKTVISDSHNQTVNRTEQVNITIGNNTVKKSEA